MKIQKEIMNEKTQFFDREIIFEPHDMPAPHFHNVNELYYMLNGQVNYLINDKLYTLGSESFIFIPKNAYHQTTYPRLGHERIVLFFSDETVSDEIKGYLDELKSSKLLRLPNEKEVLHIFHSLIKQIENEWINHKDSAQSEDLRKLYLRQLLVLLSRYGIKENDQTLSSTNREAFIIQQAIDYINANYAQDLSLDAIAAQFSYSSGHFSKLFKKITGINLMEYIMTTRIRKAEEMLIAGDLNVTQIAMRCGFNNVSYFTYNFKKINGTTPKSYAKKHQF